MQAPDLIVKNARIHTGDSAKPLASALTAKNGRIVFVGDEAAQQAGPATRIIDAHGATIIPGLIDSHVHMEGLGDQLEVIALRDAASIEEVAARVRKAAASSKPGEWIRGRGWDQNNWGGAFPDSISISLANAAPLNPVFLVRIDGHAAWVNRRALDLAGIEPHTPDPDGGRILRDTSGDPTGVLIDRAMDLVLNRIPLPTFEDTRKRLARAARECARVGLTTVHDAGVNAQTIAAYRDLIAQNELPVRVYAMIAVAQRPGMAGAEPHWREFLERGPEVGNRLTIRTLKLFADGALGSRGAALLAPYADNPDNNGLLLLSREEIENVAREALAHGFQVATHAIGDRANRTALEAYGNVLKGKNDRRFRIEHAQVVAPEDFSSFAGCSIIASVQSTHATSDLRWAAERLGTERLKHAYFARSFLTAGVPLANGSDFPVEDPNPLFGFYAAMTRQQSSGYPSGGWFPEERLTRAEALASWTMGGAYAAFEETDKGTLAPGKFADFVMLSGDIMRVPAAEILETRVLLTVSGGEVAYER